ncbi:hypothetical protein LBMAG48_04410 [Phycisphaerae bacterium]|nr:hypothetical protein LBMAG48_04410 [Phycisphaerae bacterium]
MKNSTKALLMIAACGGAVSVANAQAPYVVNLYGATLLQNLLQAPQVANDFIDVDGDTVRTPAFDPLIDLLPTTAQGAGYLPGNYYIVQYRAVGSVSGVQELVDWGGKGAGGEFTPNSANSTLPSMSSALTNPAFVNAQQFLGSGGLPSGAVSWIHTTANPGAAPFRAITSGVNKYRAAAWQGGNVNPGANTGMQNTAAPVDVPTLWTIQAGTAGDALASRSPGQVGYGTNPRTNVNRTGGSSGAGGSNALVNLGASPLNLYTGVPSQANDNTIFDTQIAWAPIAPIANFGVGISQITFTDLQHLALTGRTSTGENIHFINRDVGSGTHNAFMNSIGVDPSWGIGEYVGNVNNSAATDTPGPSWLPSNKNGTGNVRETVRYHRLTIGYVGGDSWRTSEAPFCDILSVSKNLNGRTGDFIRPRSNGGSEAGNTILDNGLRGEIDPSTGVARTVDGWQIGGKAIFATIGNPLLAPAADGGYGWSGLTPAEITAENALRAQFPVAANMDNNSSAEFLNNITRSINAFNANPTNPINLFSPGEFAATLLIPLTATDYLQGNDGVTFGLNSGRVQFTQDNIRGTVVYSQARYQAFGTSGNGAAGAAGNVGQAPRRVTGQTYSDGTTGAATTFTLQDGTTVGYGAALSGALSLNRVMGDFNNDGLRNLNDAAGLIAAWTDRNDGATVTWNAGSKASIEILGDFSGDGNFGRVGANADRMDVRYWADGLAIDPATGKLDRKAGFTAVDTAFGGNFFGTVLATGKPYAAGDARGDVANSVTGTTRGWLPIGADGNDGVAAATDNRIDAVDLDYVRTQILSATDTNIDWATETAEAARADLSADINGDLVINCADLDELLTVVLGTVAGDVNLDGVRDAADVAIVTANLGTNGGWAQGNINCDGVINQADLDLANGIVACDSIDFNQNGVFPEDQDVVDFFDVLAGGNPTTCDAVLGCQDIDFNNNGVFPEDQDVVDFFNVLAGGTCPQ